MYEKARENLAALRARAPLVVEDAPALYFYRLRMGEHEQTGVAGCFSIDEYDRDVIKKHERTRRDKEDDRTRHIVGLRAQTGVVFLTYQATADVDRLQQTVTAGTPLYDFTAPDGVHHTIWRAGARADQRAGGCLRPGAGAVHCGRASSRRQRGAGAHRAGRNGRRRGGHVHRRGVSRQPGADPPLQPDGQGSGGRDRRGVPGRVEAAGAGHAMVPRRRRARGRCRCISTAAGIRWT